MKDFHGTIPDEGLSREDILVTLSEYKKMDAAWESGRMFGFVYCPEAEATRLMREVGEHYFFENAVNTLLFPSVARLEREIVSMAAGLLHGDGRACGSVTSGGSESILLAMKAVRDHSMKVNPGLKDPEVILPYTAHPAFRKAARYLGCEVVNLPVTSEYIADTDVLPALCNDRTILLVGSAPSYSHGVMDPISEMGRFAMKKGICLHVDACLGGFFLPFMEMEGYEVPLFDFRVPGVTSISADLHKYGYSAKGASVVLYCERDLWRHQFFAHSDWPGGLFGTPTFLGSHNGYAAATAWSMLMHFGLKRYRDMTRDTMRAVEELKKGICEIRGLHIAGNPVMGVFTFTSEQADIFRIGDDLQARGWALDRILDPAGLHMLVSYQNLGHTGEFLRDLEACTAAVRGQGSSSFYGIAGSTDVTTSLDDIVINYLDETYSFRKA